MEKSYVEIKVSFIHIIILLIGVFMICSFLFYLGYQAGKSAVRSEFQASTNNTTLDKTEELKLSDDQGKSQKQEPEKKKPDSISDEIRLHQLPVSTTGTDAPVSTNDTATTPAKNEKKPETKLVEDAKPIQKEPYFTIQVGAFADYSNAQKYSTKFANMGHPTEINPYDSNHKKLYRVWVGNYKTKADAQKLCDKLSKSENKVCKIVKSN